jgi:lactoylglutathione lyase
MAFKMVHNNINVSDLDKSLAFYQEALGLEPSGTIEEASDGSYRIVFLKDGISEWNLELTWLKEHSEPYDLGENEIHLAFKADDFDAAHEKHAAMGCICFENAEMGIYFIEDPDGYWMEIVP